MKIPLRAASLLIVLVVSGVLGENVRATSPVTAVDLGTLGGTYSYALAVNNAGQIVGYSGTAGDATWHAFSWTRAGGMVDLGTLGGSDSYAVAVNEGGQVVGYSPTPGNAAWHAFSWTQAGGMVDLGTLGGTSSYASAVSDAGQVVGYSPTAGDAAWHAFSWTPAGGMVDLGTLGGTNSYAFAVNEGGQVVGYSGTAGGALHAFSWTPAGGMVDLGTLGGTYSYPYSVNDAGQVVGSTTADQTTWHAFSWTQAGGMVDLGTLGGTDGFGYSVNDAGQIVGWSFIVGNGATHATLWEAAPPPADDTPPVLTLPNLVLAEATSSAGAVVSWIASALDDVDGAVTPVCEPPSGWTFALGTTTVTCTASDSSGNSGSGGFPVTVQDTTAPVLTAPPGVTAEATGAQTVGALGTATASDAADPAPVITNDAPATFALGTTMVRWTARDASGNTSTATQTVTVQDTTPPVLTLPAPLVAEATSRAGAEVSYTASALDTVDGALKIKCGPAPGSMFPLGPTTVTCSAGDGSGNSSTGSFEVTVVDTTPPVLTLPAPLVVEATSGAGAEVSYTASAVDAVDGALKVTCGPASGTMFAFGMTTVNCSTQDKANNAATGSFVVTVRDTTAPALTAPSNQIVEATGPSGAIVAYPAPTATDAVGVTSLSCTPASGSTFGMDVTVVTCTAKDAAGNTATTTFSVTVQDKTAPTIRSLTVMPGSLWPPNHKMVNVTIAASATDAVTMSPSCTITLATSSEPDNGLGDGDTAGDIGPLDLSGLSISLRAERGGNGPGRVYTLEVTCTDSANNRAKETTAVIVPKSQAK